MVRTPTSSQRVLNWSAIAIATVAVYELINWSTHLYGMRDQGLREFLLLIAIYSMTRPALYLALAWPLRRHNYAALVACGVLSATNLATDGFGLSLSLPYQTLTSVLTHLTSPTVVLAAALVARPAFVHWPNPQALRNAARRAAFAMLLSGVVQALLGAAAFIAMAPFRIRFQGAMVGTEQLPPIAVVASFAAVCLLCSAMLFRSAPAVWRGQRPGWFAMCSAIVCAATMIVAVGFLFRYVLSYSIGRGLFGYWLLPNAVEAVSFWTLIELLHARRLCAEPAAYGFEPIYATPVIPAADSPSHS